MKYKSLIMLIFSVFLVFGCKLENKKQQYIFESNLEKFQEKLLDLHNTERQLRGLDFLVLDVDLCNYAQKHAEKMLKEDSLHHSKMNDLFKVKNSVVVGENIAWGQQDENSVVISWMKSPFHRWNILGENYKRVGFGLAKTKENIYWCAVFSN